LNGQTSQILLSLHLLQTSPGLISAIFVAVSSMSSSNDLVIGFFRCHASLRKVALPIWDSSGVYAMRFISFLWIGLYLLPDRLIHTEPITLLLVVLMKLID